MKLKNIYRMRWVYEPDLGGWGEYLSPPFPLLTEIGIVHIISYIKDI